MDKKESILNAALKLFVEKGFHGTATSKIAKQAGVANGTLFQYFKTKDELVIALYIQIKEELVDYVAQHIADNFGIKKKIRAQILSTLLWALDNSTKFYFIQQIHSSPYISLIDQDILYQHAKPHLLLIQEGIDQGALKQLPVDLIYSLISNQVFGLFQYITSQELTKIKRQETIETTIGLLWKMLT